MFHIVFYFIPKADHDVLLNQIKEEKEHAVEEIMVLSKKIGRLEEAVTIKEEETDKLCKSLVIINIKKFMAIFLFSDRSCKYSITA